MTLRLVRFFSVLFLFSCTNENNTAVSGASFPELPLKYAKNYTIQGEKGTYIIRTNSTGNSSQATREIHCFNKNPEIPGDVISIKSVPDKVLVISTTYLGYIESLDEISRIAGVSNADLVYSPSIRKRIESGEIVDIGNDQALNYERIIELDADLILMYDFGSSTSAVVKKLEELDQVVIKIDEFRELTPLGKAEWIKFFGVLFNKYDLADRIFNGIEENYLELLKMNDSLGGKPTVFTGLPWKGQWYQPGGASFQAAFFSDAGADYLWRKDKNTAGITIDREVVFDKALKAHFWLHPGNVTRLEEIYKEDERYAYFESFKKHRVYNNNLRVNNNMGNDYWESGLLNPHLILKDLMAIFHPEIFPGHDFYYYREVK